MLGIINEKKPVLVEKKGKSGNTKSTEKKVSSSEQKKVSPEKKGKFIFSIAKQTKSSKQGAPGIANKAQTLDKVPSSKEDIVIDKTDSPLTNYIEADVNRLIIQKNENERLEAEVSEETKVEPQQITHSTVKDDNQSSIKKTEIKRSKNKPVQNSSKGKQANN